MKGKIKKVEDFSFLLEPDPKGEKKFDGKNYNVFPYAEEWGLEKDATKSSKTNIAYIFDNSGKNLEIITYNAEDQPFGGMRFFYDKNGHINRSQSVFTTGDGEFTVDRKYFYNEKNQLVKIDEYDGDTWLITITYKYDDWGNSIEKNKMHQSIWQNQGKTLGEEIRVGNVFIMMKKVKLLKMVSEQLMIQHTTLTEKDII